jgi:hypothetical protein
MAVGMFAFHQAQKFFRETVPLAGSIPFNKQKINFGVTGTLMNYAEMS